MAVALPVCGTAAGLRIELPDGELSDGELTRIVNEHLRSGVLAAPVAALAESQVTLRGGASVWDRLASADRSKKIGLAENYFYPELGGPGKLWGAGLAVADLVRVDDTLASSGLRSAGGYYDYDIVPLAARLKAELNFYMVARATNTATLIDRILDRTDPDDGTFGISLDYNFPPGSHYYGLTVVGFKQNKLIPAGAYFALRTGAEGEEFGAESGAAELVLDRWVARLLGRAPSVAGRR
jgi:hypothetical protein